MTKSMVVLAACCVLGVGCGQAPASSGSSSGGGGSSGSGGAPGGSSGGSRGASASSSGAPGSGSSSGSSGGDGSGGASSGGSSSGSSGGSGSGGGGGAGSGPPPSDGGAGTGGDDAGVGPRQRYLYAGWQSTVNVYDIDNGHRMVKSIPSLAGAGGDLRGMCASVPLHTLFLFYFTNATTGRVIAMDLLTDKEIWSKDITPGADRGEVSHDGTKLYVPAGENYTTPLEYVIDARNGDPITQFTLTPKVHDTDIGASGKYAYLETKSSPIVSVVDIASDQIVRQLTFSDIAGPHVVNAADTYVAANVFQLFGFEMADVNTGMVIATVKATGVADPGVPNPPALLNHAIALKPDETELWLGSKYTPDVFVFDMTVMPPKQTRIMSIGGGYKVTHWITFSIDGAYGYPSPDAQSGIPVQVIDTKTYQPVATIGYSEDITEVDFSGGQVVAVGSQYGIGRKGVGP
jgi:hypothetical protein